MSEISSQLCSVCSSANLQREDFEQPPFEPEGKYNSLVLSGSLGHLRSNKTKCSLCRLIVYALRRNEGQMLDEQSGETEWEMKWSQNNYEYDPETNEAEDLYGSGLFPKLKVEGSNTDHGIQLVDGALTDGFLRGRAIPESIDAAMVRGWVLRCADRHGDACKPSYIQSPQHPAVTMEFVVIDVNRECLVTMPAAAKYVALSYVWGRAKQLTTVKSTVSEFHTPGAFSKTKPPRTIQDAIDLTRALGFQYLWVDALCIVQDDDDTKALLISNMDAVYSHAALTIVAASGLDADAGLGGWRSSPPERELVTASMGLDWKLGVLPVFDVEVMKCTHATRGWTYQEGYLSPRCLVILDGKAFFSCRAAVWREDVMAEVEDVRPLEGANTLGRTPSPWPLRRYAQIVDAYTMRQLTYSSDILNAFAGIAKSIATSMSSTRMFCALPAVAFDWAILWTGHLMFGELKRQPGFPSWAWVGWQGGIMIGGDSYSSLDQRWLLERTWIEWYITLENGEAVLMWDPGRDGTVISPLITGVPGLNLDESRETWSKTEPQKANNADDSETKRKAISKEENDGEGDDDDKDEESDKSDESDEDDDEEEDEDICPTYGRPSPNNPYGRTPNPHLLSSLPSQTNSAQRTPSSCYLPSTLVFSTVIASFTLDSSSSPTTGEGGRGARIFKLRDAAGRICGFIWDDLAPVAEESRGVEPVLVQSAETREVLLLSQASRAMMHGVRGDEIGFAEEYRPRESREEALKVLGMEEREEVEVDGEEVQGDWHSWEFFNIMLVVRTSEGEEGGEGESDGGCLYERAGIGFLHKDALACALGPEPCWRMVGLR